MQERAKMFEKRKKHIRSCNFVLGGKKQAHLRPIEKN
jgi:hypothetical protein